MRCPKCDALLESTWGGDYVCPEHGGVMREAAEAYAVPRIVWLYPLSGGRAFTAAVEKRLLKEKVVTWNGVACSWSPLS